MSLNSFHAYCVSEVVNVIKLYGTHTINKILHYYLHNIKTYPKTIKFSKIWSAIYFLGEHKWEKSP